MLLKIIWHPNKIKMDKPFQLIVLFYLCGYANSNSVTDVFESTSSWIRGATDGVLNYYCNKYECCEDVPFDLPNLRTLLNTRLYGQHIAAEVVLYAINSHMRKTQPKKPLVMSFHGSNGVGKTYVSRMVARTLYKKGDNSRYFHFYYGLENFPFIDKVSEYQIQLKNEIEAAISNCERSLFVFDGVDQMPAGLLDTLMPFIDCPNCGNKMKNKSIFIFLTNTGSLAIQKRLLDIYNDGHNRQSTTLKDFEKIIISETFSRTGGLFESIMIKSDAIDFYIPFLPLEKEHVKYCIREAFEELNMLPTKDLIDEVFQELRFGPEPENLFSNSGCKRVAQIAGRVVARLDPEFDNSITDSSSKSEL